MEDQQSDEQLGGWLEFGCWSALVMAPLIYWLQGPSVSEDQRVVRTALVVLAALGAIGLRIRAVRQRRRSEGRAAAAEAKLPAD